MEAYRDSNDVRGGRQVEGGACDIKVQAGVPGIGIGVKLTLCELEHVPIIIVL